ncbi:hypothetical protein J5N97_006745 [Dioscorea zingiberensis]|uniref:Uncharacterized protein n=1 Tax=Dioscorea zingiberensis TaxID=325984 RepID=A0A9D5DBX7_9LILI|nr:hypothetical protein J5N97_006745 [Dioscorea zingiberensis]
MGEVNQRSVLGDLTNKRVKRPPELVLDKFENQYKFGRFGETDSVEATSDRCSLEGKEILTKGKGKVGSTLENSRGVENGGMDLALYSNALKHHGPLFPWSMKENLSLDLSQCGKVSEEIPCSLTPELLSGRSDTAACSGKSRNNCFSFGCSHDQHNNSEDSSPMSEDSSLKSEDLQEDYETDNADFSKHAMEKRRGDVSSFPLNDTGLCDNGDGNNDDEHLTQDLLGKSYLGRCSGPSGFDMGNLRRLTDAHVTSNVDDVVKVEDNTGFENTCSCSFCLKAAYMWMDLHYQDARGRLSALKKSRRYAKSLDQRFHNLDVIAKLDRDNPTMSKKLESDLMQHWRSLFVHTEKILALESVQIQSNLLKLKDLKENCKKDLEMASIASHKK